MESGIDTTGFFSDLFTTILTNQSPEEFAERAVRHLTCKWCAEGWPVDENGQHDMLGVIVPCEAGGARED